MFFWVFLRGPLRPLRLRVKKKAEFQNPVHSSARALYGSGLSGLGTRT